MTTATENLAAELLKAIGDNADDQEVTQWIDTGYAPLNKVMAGAPDRGLPFGRMVEMFGESSTGKTALATRWMVNAQQMGGVAGFMDWERSFNVTMAKGFGLNVERPFWIYGKPRTWEEGNMVAAKACQAIRKSKAIAEEAPILFVFDSIAAAMPKSMADKEIDEYSMNDTTALARVTSTTLKSMAHHCEEFNSTFLYLNQMRLKPGVVYGDPRTTPGGKAMEFYASARLALGRQKIVEGSGKEAEFVGQKISIQAVKSKFTKPFNECSLRMSFDDDGVASFDPVISMLDELVEAGKLPYTKPRATWTDGKQYYLKALAQKLNAEGQYPNLVNMLYASK